MTYFTAAVLTALLYGLVSAAIVPWVQGSRVPVALPPPTGPFQVGRVTAHWTDRSRIEPMAVGRSPRELMIDVWYPAEPSTRPVAPYIVAAAFTRRESEERLRDLLGSAYAPVMAGQVRSNAVESARFAVLAAPTPVLIFSHGGGMPRETYAAQLTDLASHGYVVAAITHTYDAVLTVFPDGRHVYLTPNRWPPPNVSGVEGLPPSEEANPQQLRWWADDIRFVLNELSRENGSSSSPLPFAGYLNLERVGAFGHSAGGQAAAHACQIDRRLKACLNQDGLTGFAPYYLDEAGWGMDQAFMLIVRAQRTHPPTDDELASMQMTREQAGGLIARLEARQEAALRNTGGGSFRVTIQRAGTTHADFTDLPVLQAGPEDDVGTRLRVLQVIRTYTRAFFHQELRGLNSTVLGAQTRTELVVAIDRFEPARRSP
jgi:predicted dienelactone hydrolase